MVRWLMVMAVLGWTTGVAGVANAQKDCSDMPSPYTNAPCTIEDQNICEYDSTDNVVYCWGSIYQDQFNLVSWDDSPIAFGVIASNTLTPTTFCCDDTQLDADDHDLEMYLYDSQDKVCLNDETADWCTQTLGSSPAAVPWKAPAYISAGGGNDRIMTHRGSLTAYDDTVDGGDGADDIQTFLGDDKIDAGAGNDVVRSGDGDDTVEAGPGDDTVYAGDGEDAVNGDDGSDTLYGQGDNDQLCGGDGGTLADPEDIYGGAGTADCLCGGDIGAGGNDDGGYDDMDGGGDSTSDDCYYVTTGNLDTTTNCSASATTTCSCTCP